MGLCKCLLPLSCAFFALVAFLVWKLYQPSTLSEVKDGLGDLYDAAGDRIGDLLDAAGDKWDEWDLGNFTEVLDGLSDSDFGNLFDDSVQSGDGETLVWDNDHVRPNDGGLHLTLRNALDDTWQDEFQQAVSDWRESDALILAAQQVAVDHTCERVDGVMVVCNANFGDTGWVGINENSIVRGRIVSSVAKMNEYYLRNANYHHRRFTMCHEIGHGFGLPHTDENPYNRNLGNCLDYTTSPKDNIMPGEVNMAKLREAYLTRRRRRVREDGAVVITTRLVRR